MSVKARVSRRGARDQTYGALENTGVIEGLRLNIRDLHAGGETHALLATLGDQVPAEEALPGVERRVFAVAQSGDLAGPGLIRHTNNGPTYLGELDRSRTPRLARLHDLLAEARKHNPALMQAERLLFIPDVLAYWLTGRQAVERTVASTSQ